MSEKEREGAHPLVGGAVLTLAAVAALLLAIGLVRAVMEGEVLAPLETEPGRWPALVLAGEPAGLLGLGAALLLLLPVVRDLAIAALAAKERGWARAGLGALGALLLLALYAGLLAR